MKTPSSQPHSRSSAQAVAPPARLRRAVKGQTLVVVGLTMTFLIACVGLAVDGGSMYSQRRRAQNAADGASLAAATKMLDHYRTMIEANGSDVDGSAGWEDDVNAVLIDYARKNGVQVSAANLQAYFVNDNKQVVTAVSGEGGCGTSNPCRVGANGRIPWTRGAKGIAVKTYTDTDAYFMSLFGWNRVGAAADATAFMGVSTNIDGNVGLTPIGFFTDTERLAQLQVGQEYTLIQGSTRQGSGNWGWIDFNGHGNPAGMVNTWLLCGFNPSVTTADWANWCPADDRATNGAGPTMYWTGTGEPLDGPYRKPTIEWPPAPNGWWIAGSSGTTNSTCQFFDSIAGGMVGKDYLIPVFDESNGRGGDNTKFHLIGLAWFHITAADIECHPRQGQEQHWSLLGEFRQHYSSGGSGGHGDVRHTSSPQVFLEP